MDVCVFAALVLTIHCIQLLRLSNHEVDLTLVTTRTSNYLCAGPYFFLRVCPVRQIPV
jgi:hypothetical protein